MTALLLSPVSFKLFWEKGKRAIEVRKQIYKDTILPRSSSLHLHLSNGDETKEAEGERN
jgi:hypothetical protein